MTQTQKFGQIMAAAAVVLLAFWLAVYDLEFRSMWYDEWLSWNWSQMNPIVMTTDTTNNGGHPPTYYAFLWLWTTVTQTQQLSAMRLSSTLFGVMTVALTYRLSLAWFENHRVALVAALVMAISSMFVYFMRELRMYTLMTLLVTVSWWAFWRFANGKKHGALMYGLTLAVMAYTYYFTAFMAFVQLVMAVIFYRERLLRLLVVYAGVLLVLAPWVPSLVVQIQNDAQYLDEGEGLELPLIGMVGKGAASQASDADSIRSFVRRYTNGQPYVVFGLAALGAVMGAAHYWQNPERRRWFVAVLLWSAGTTLVFFGGNFITPIYNPRYLLMIVPGLGMLVALAWVDLPPRYQWALGAGLVVFGLLTHTAGFFGLREPHDDLLGTVAANFQEGDRIWYNLEAGAEGSSLFSAPEYYLAVKYTNLTEDDFIWNASEDFEDPAQVPSISAWMSGGTTVKSSRTSHMRGTCAGSSKSSL
ncbi:MAG: glycosyltransferase family 39 protein, partial [Chloroflexota bacterium]